MSDILVLTATLGDRDSLQRTIDSVCEIGGTRVKHLIIAPENNVAALSKKFPALEIIAEPKNNKGIYGALNYGFNKYGKDYKYLTFINDDDYWLESYCDLINYLDNHISIDVVYARTIYLNTKNDTSIKQTCSPRYKAFEKLLVEDIVLFTQQATLLRSNVFFEVGGFDEKYKLIADTNFWLSTIKRGFKFKYINCFCAVYSIQDGQLSSNKNLQNTEHKLLLKEKRSSLSSKLEKFLFRINNIDVYVSRLFLNRKIRRMSDYFHP